MSYKDTKIFHKDFGDGGRKARKGIEQIVARKEQKNLRLADVANAVADETATETTAMECNDCGYIGDEKEDFELVPVTEHTLPTDGIRRACPSCGSWDCVPYTEEEI